jgi:hypothetical protein
MREVEVFKKMREVNEALKKLELFYLDFFNNYLSVKKFSEFYGISEDKAVTLIDMGRVINHKGLRNE